jgi:glycosyltransferase involved in cell wall biosynthesis
VQPTLFEGGPGGGATFDAVALGIPSLLSDIPVNLEISDPLVRFFKTSNAESLAEKMMEIPANPPIRRNDVFLQEKSDHYARELGLSLCELANAACV